MPNEIIEAANKRMQDLQAHLPQEVVNLYEAAMALEKRDREAIAKGILLAHKGGLLNPEKRLAAVNIEAIVEAGEHAPVVASALVRADQEKLFDGDDEMTDLVYNGIVAAKENAAKVADGFCISLQCNLLSTPMKTDMLNTVFSAGEHAIEAARAIVHAQQNQLFEHNHEFSTTVFNIIKKAGRNASNAVKAIVYAQQNRLFEHNHEFSTTVFNTIKKAGRNASNAVKAIVYAQQNHEFSTAVFKKGKIEIHDVKETAHKKKFRDQVLFTICENMAMVSADGYSLSYLCHDASRVPGHNSSTPRQSELSQQAFQSNPFITPQASQTQEPHPFTYLNAHPHEGNPVTPGRTVEDQPKRLRMGDSTDPDQGRIKRSKREEGTTELFMSQAGEQTQSSLPGQTSFWSPDQA